MKLTRSAFLAVVAARDALGQDWGSANSTSTDMGTAGYNSTNMDHANYNPDGSAMDYTNYNVMYKECFCAGEVAKNATQKIEAILDNSGLYDLYDKAGLDSKFSMVKFAVAKAKHLAESGVFSEMGINSVHDLNMMVDFSEAAPIVNLVGELFQSLMDHNGSQVVEPGLTFMKMMFNDKRFANGGIASSLMTRTWNDFLAVYETKMTMNPANVDTVDTLLRVGYEIVCSALDFFTAPKVVSIIDEALTEMEPFAVAVDDWIRSESGGEFVRMVVGKIGHVSEIIDVQEQVKGAMEMAHDSSYHHSPSGSYHSPSGSYHSPGSPMSEPESGYPHDQDHSMDEMDPMLMMFMDYMNEFNEATNYGMDLETFIKTFGHSSELMAFVGPFDAEDQPEIDFMANYDINAVLMPAPYEGRLNNIRAGLHTLVTSGTYSDFLDYFLGLGYRIFHIKNKDEFVSVMTPTVSEMMTMLPATFDQYQAFEMFRTFVPLIMSNTPSDEMMAQIWATLPSDNSGSTTEHLPCNCHYRQDFPSIAELHSMLEYAGDYIDEIHFGSCNKAKPIRLTTANLDTVCGKAHRTREPFDSNQFGMWVMAQCFGRQYREMTGINREDNVDPDFEVEMTEDMTTHHHEPSENDLHEKMAKLGQFNEIRKICKEEECLWSPDESCMKSCFEWRKNEMGLGEWEDEANCMDGKFMRKLVNSTANAMGFTDHRQTAQMGNVAQCMSKLFKAKAIRNTIGEKCEEHWCNHRYCEGHENNMHNEPHHEPHHEPNYEPYHDSMMTDNYEAPHHDEHRQPCDPGMPSSHTNMGMNPTFNINFNGMPMMMSQNGNDWNMEGSNHGDGMPHHEDGKPHHGSDGRDEMKDDYNHEKDWENKGDHMADMSLMDVLAKIEGMQDHLVEKIKNLGSNTDGECSDRPHGETGDMTNHNDRPAGSGDGNMNDSDRPSGEQDWSNKTPAGEQDWNKPTPAGEQDWNNPADGTRSPSQQGSNDSTDPSGNQNGGTNDSTDPSGNQDWNNQNPTDGTRSPSQQGTNDSTNTSGNQNVDKQDEEETEMKDPTEEQPKEPATSDPTPGSETPVETAPTQTKAERYTAGIYKKIGAYADRNEADKKAIAAGLQACATNLIKKCYSSNKTAMKKIFTLTMASQVTDFNKIINSIKATTQASAITNISKNTCKTKLDAAAKAGNVITQAMNKNLKVTKYQCGVFMEQVLPEAFMADKE